MVLISGMSQIQTDARILRTTRIASGELVGRGCHSQLVEGYLAVVLYFGQHTPKDKDETQFEAQYKNNIFSQALESRKKDKQNTYCRTMSRDNVLKKIKGTPTSKVPHSS